MSGERHNVVVRESADGLTRTEFDFHAHLETNSLRLSAYVSGTAIYRRASVRHKWRKPERWASYNKASGTSRPEVPDDVLAEARQRILTSVTVTIE